MTSTPKEVTKIHSQKISFTINSDDFLNKVDPKLPDRKEDNFQQKTEPKTDPTDQMIEDHLLKIWPVYENFQKNCNPPVQVDKEIFLKNFPRLILKKWFKQYGNDFAISQESSLNTILSDQKIIELCIKREGKGQIFTNAIDYHYNLYSNWIDKNKQIEQEAFDKTQSLKLAEENKARDEREKSKFSLLAALYAFGVFMSLTMLLIFSKIESNLRTTNRNSQP